MRIPGYLLRTSTTFYAYAGESATGPTYSAGVTLRGHWEGSRRLFVDENGRQVIAEAMFLVDLDAPVTVESKIEKDGVPYRVISVNRREFVAGTPNHLEIRLAPFRKGGVGI